MWKLTVLNLTFNTTEVYSFTFEDMIEKLEVINLNIDEKYTIEFIAQ